MKSARSCSYKGRIEPAQQPFAITDAAHLLCHHPSIWSAIYRKSFLDKHNIRFREPQAPAGQTTRS